MAKYYKASPNPVADPYVRGIQEKLNTIRTTYHGSWPYVATDGKYGPMTAEAVKGFQAYKNIRPVSGELGPTTADYIEKAYRSMPMLSAASGDLREVPRARKLKDMSLTDHAGYAGDAASLGALLSDGSLPWVKQFIKSFPVAFYKIRNNPKAPLMVFTRQDAYRTWGQIYKRVDVRNIGETVPDYLSKVAYICQLLTIKSKIDEFKRKKFDMGDAVDWGRLAGIGGEITTLVTGGADILAQYFPKVMGKLGYNLAKTGAGITLGTGATLSAIGQGIGAFLLGWELGKLMGKIPCGNGKNVQYYIDRYIDCVWEHPYQTVGLIPAGGMGLATGIAALKKAIDWNVNRVKVIRPLTDVEKRKLEQYKMQHREMFIQTAPPRLTISAAR